MDKEYGLFDSPSLIIEVSPSLEDQSAETTKNVRLSQAKYNRKQLFRKKSPDKPKENFCNYLLRHKRPLVASTPNTNSPRTCSNSTLTISPIEMPNNNTLSVHFYKEDTVINEPPRSDTTKKKVTIDKINSILTCPDAKSTALADINNQESTSCGNVYFLRKRQQHQISNKSDTSSKKPVNKRSRTISKKTVEKSKIKDVKSSVGTSPKLDIENIQYSVNQDTSSKKPVNKRSRTISKKTVEKSKIKDVKSSVGTSPKLDIENIQYSVNQETPRSKPIIKSTGGTTTIASVCTRRKIEAKRIINDVSVLQDVENLQCIQDKPLTLPIAKSTRATSREKDVDKNKATDALPIINNTPIIEKVTNIQDSFCEENSATVENVTNIQNGICEDWFSETPKLDQTEGISVIYSLRNIKDPMCIYSGGYLIFGPDVEKCQLPRNHSILYKVEEGRALVEQQLVSQIMEVKSNFYIPLGSQYKIKNLSDRNRLVLHFSKMSNN